MKILVVADSHGDVINLRNLYLKHQDQDLYLHLGDYEVDENLLPSVFVGVKGNNDYYSSWPLRREINLDGFRIVMEHGHNYRFKDDNYIRSLNADIYLYGHTHVRSFRKVDNTFIFNPGSFTRPRDSYYLSYLLIEIEKGEIKYKFMTL